MRRKAWSAAACVVVLAWASTIVSCTNEVISSDAGTLTFRVASTAGSRFSTASIFLGSVKVKPVSPEAQSSLGDQNLTLFTGTTVVDINASPRVVYSVTLGAGTYEVTELSLATVTLDGGTPASSPTTCEDLVTDPSNEAANTSLVPPSPLATFTITGRGSHVFDLLIDTDAFVDHYLGSYTSCSGGVVSGFDLAAYQQGLYPDTIRFVQSQ